MTEQQFLIYTRTVRRLARGGIRDPTAQIIALAEEVERYRTKIYALESRLEEMQAAHIAHPPKPRYTHYDPGLDRFVVPLIYTDHDDTVSFRLGMCTEKYPDCIFGKAIDRLAELENREEAKKDATPE